MTSHANQPVSFSLRLAAALEANVLLLVCVLPFLVPFGLTRNINLQAIVVCLTGGLAWVAVSCRSRMLVKQLPAKLAIALGVYLAWSVLAVLVHPSLNNLLGGPLMRLGSLELISCVGCGLALLAIPSRKLLQWFYSAMVALAVISVPYSFIQADGISRVGGLLHQPDFLAVLLAIGLLFGMSLWQTLPHNRRLLAITQIVLGSSLLLTQTRAVIAITLAISLYLLWQQHTSRLHRFTCSVLVLVTVVVGSILISSLSSNRLTDPSYASASVSYRLTLQHYALRAAIQKPLFGYGAGSVDQALACPTLQSPVLQHTCHEHYYFDSSHNVFLDRCLGLGWLGGLAFVMISLLALVAGFRQPSANRAFISSSLLIVLYYCTNVSNLDIELLLWICLLHCVPLLPPAKPQKV